MSVADKIKYDDLVKTEYTVTCYAGKAVIFRGAFVKSHVDAIIKEIKNQTGERWVVDENVAKDMCAGIAIINPALNSDCA
jgi:hypothetical protein